MLAHIGQRLLDDAVHGQIDALRHRLRATRFNELHRHTRRARLLEQTWQLRNPRLRCVRAGLVIAQDPEQPVHVRQRCAPRVSHGQHGRTCLLRIRFDGGGRAVGQHRDNTQGM